MKSHLKIIGTLYTLASILEHLDIFIKCREPNRYKLLMNLQSQGRYSLNLEEHTITTQDLMVNFHILYLVLANILILLREYCSYFKQIRNHNQSLKNFVLSGFHPEELHIPSTQTLQKLIIYYFQKSMLSQDGISSFQIRK